MERPPFFHPFAIIESGDGTTYLCPPVMHPEVGLFGNLDPYIEDPLETRIEPKEWQAIKPHVDSYLERLAFLVVEEQGPAGQRIRRLAIPIGSDVDFFIDFMLEAVSQVDLGHLADLARTWFEDYARFNANGAGAFLEAFFPLEPAPSTATTSAAG